MSQYSAGRASVTNGSATVTAANEADWTSVTTTYRFGVSGDDKVYGIVAATPGTLTLETAYQGVTASTAEYSITRDFTANLFLPLIYGGDLNTRPLLRQLAETLDLVWGPGGGGGNGGGSSLAAYLLIGENDPSLENARQLLVELGLLLTDGGPSGSAILSLDFATVAEAQGGLDVPKIMSPFTTAQAIAAQAGGAGEGGAPVNAPYIVIGTAPASLTGERMLTVTASLTVTDNGANSTVVLSANLATQAEAELGVEATHLMTAQRSAQQLAAKGVLQGPIGHNIMELWAGTAAEYAALGTYSPTTLYAVTA